METYSNLIGRNDANSKISQKQGRKVKRLVKFDTLNETNIG